MRERNCYCVLKRESPLEGEMIMMLLQVKRFEVAVLVCYSTRDNES